MSSRVLPSANILFMDLVITIKQLYQHTSNFKEKVYEWHLLLPAATDCQGEARRFMEAERQVSNEMNTKYDVMVWSQKTRVYGNCSCLQ